MPEPIRHPLFEAIDEPQSAYAQHVRKWLDAHAGEGGRGFHAAVKAGGAELELSMLDMIGADWWSGGGVTSKWVKQQLDANPDATTIRVLLDSPGGSVFDGVAIHNLLKRHKANVEIEVIGEASSAASVIAMAGNTIKMHEGTAMMIHRASCMAWGFDEDLRTAADALTVITGSITDIYETRTGRARADIEAMVKKETWMSASVAVKEGFADEVVKAGSKPTPVKTKAKNDSKFEINIDTNADPNVVAEQIRVAMSRLEGIRPTAVRATAPEETNAPDGAPTETTAPPAQEEDRTMSQNDTMTTIRALLGLGAGTPDSDAVAAVTRLRAVEAEAMRVTGAAGTEEAIGGLKAIKDKADRVDAVAKELGDVKSERDKQNFETLIAKGLTVPAKLTPATAADWRTHFDAALAVGNGASEVARLQGFLKNAPVVINQAPRQASVGATIDGNGEAPSLVYNGKSYEQLSYAERGALKTENHELWSLMNDDWKRRGKPAAKSTKAA